jgi:hypothetical protein
VALAAALATALGREPVTTNPKDTTHAHR